MNAHFLVKVRHAKTVYARNSCNYNYIATFHKAVSCLKPQLVNFAVDVAVFFYVKVSRCYVSLRLVIRSFSSGVR